MSFLKFTFGSAGAGSCDKVYREETFASEQQDDFMYKGQSCGIHLKSLNRIENAELCKNKCLSHRACDTYTYFPKAKYCNLKKSRDLVGNRITVYTTKMPNDIPNNHEIQFISTEDCGGNEIGHFSVSRVEQCRQACEANESCQSFIVENGQIVGSDLFNKNRKRCRFFEHEPKQNAAVVTGMIRSRMTA